MCEAPTSEESSSRRGETRRENDSMTRDETTNENKTERLSAEACRGFGRPSQQLISRGDELFSQCRFNKSLACYRHALANEEKSKMEPEGGDCFVATVLTKLGKCHLARGEFTHATNRFQRALSVYRSAGIDDEHPDVVHTKRSIDSMEKTTSSIESSTGLEKVGRSRELSGCYDRAMEAYTDALTMKRAALGNIHPFVAFTLNKIGVLHWKKGSYHEATKTLKKALRIYELTLGEEHLEYSDTLSNIGTCHHARGEYEDAMKCHQASLVIRKGALGECHPTVGRTLIQIGMVLSERGNHRKAMKLYREGLRIQRASLGNCHVDVASTLNCIGVLFEKRGELNMAMKAYKEALEMYRATLGEEHVDVAVTLTNMGQIFCQLGNSEKAMRTYERALKVMKDALGENHRNCAAALHSIGRLYSMRDENNEALDLFKEVLQVQRSALGDEHADVAITLIHMAEVYERKGDLAESNDQAQFARYKKARRCYIKALKVRIAALGENHVYVALLLHKIACFHLEKEKDYREALRRYTEALNIFRICEFKEGDAHVKDTVHWISFIEAKLAAINSKGDSNARTGSPSKKSFESVQ